MGKLFGGGAGWQLPDGSCQLSDDSGGGGQVLVIDWIIILGKDLGGMAKSEILSTKFETISKSKLRRFKTLPCVLC